jgi:hypothetical protein
MKKALLLVTILLCFCDIVQGQNIKLRLQDDSTSVNTVGTVINKGDEFIVSVKADGNGNATARSLYFDFEYQNTAFELVTVTNTGTGGNGGILPYGSSITMDWYTYPGYTWTSSQQNTTPDGNTNYNRAAYSFTAGGPKTILRVYLNWASPNGMPYSGGWDDLIRLKFKLKTTAPGYAWDPIKMNFAAAFNSNGTAGSTEMTIPLTSVIYLDPTATKYVNATIETNPNIDNFSLHRVLFLNPITNVGIIADATAAGAINIDQSRLEPNTEYRVMMMLNMDSIHNLYAAAVTVSDYTTAQAEFVQQNLDGTYKGQSIITGAGYLAADVNRSKTFDGGDLTKLYSQVIGVDKLFTLPSNYAAGTDMYASVPTFTDSTFNALTPANWKDVTNSYVTFKTGLIGQNKPLKLKFLIPGDINRSHSSQMMINGTIATNAAVSLKTNLTANKTLNRTVAASNITVSLANQTLTSNTIEIPIKVNTNGNKLSGLQFEFRYNPASIKFEEIMNQMPNTWYAFADNTKPGVIRFGALDKALNSSVTGELVPFKLKFSAITNGLDMNTLIKVSPVMDAASSTGSQLGITLNSDTIKITGYNNF